MRPCKPIALIAAAAALLAACAPVRPHDVVVQEQAACFAMGPQSQACADYAQDKAALDHNAQVAAVATPLLVLGAIGLAVAGVAAHPGPPGPHGPPPPHPVPPRPGF